MISEILQPEILLKEGEFILVKKQIVGSDQLAFYFIRSLMSSTANVTLKLT